MRFLGFYVRNVQAGLSVRWGPGQASCCLAGGAASVAARAHVKRAWGAWIGVVGWRLRAWVTVCCRLVGVVGGDTMFLVVHAADPRALSGTDKDIRRIRWVSDCCAVRAAPKHAFLHVSLRGFGRDWREDSCSYSSCRVLRVLGCTK